MALVVSFCFFFLKLIWWIVSDILRYVPFQISASLVGLTLVLLSFPEHGSLNRVLDGTSGRIFMLHLLMIRVRMSYNLLCIVRNCVFGVSVSQRGSASSDWADGCCLCPHKGKVDRFHSALIWSYLSENDWRNNIHVFRVKKSWSESSLRSIDLLAQFKQIETSTRTQIQAAELLDNTVELIREMVYTNTMKQPNPYGTKRQFLGDACVCLKNSSTFC